MNTIAALSRAHKATLTPHSPMRFVRCQTIGYHSGELPSVIVHIGGDKYELWPGQVIPTGDTIVMVENPYERHGEVQFVINADPQPIADVRAGPGSRQSKFVTYQTRVAITGVTDTDPRGCMIYQRDGLGLLRLEGDFLGLSRFWTGVTEDMLNGRPAAMYPDAQAIPAHTSGSVHPRLMMAKGKRGPLEDFDNYFLANYGIAWGHGKNLTAGPDGSIEVILEGPVLVFAYDLAQVNVGGKIAVIYEDYGMKDGAAYV